VDIEEITDDLAIQVWSTLAATGGD